MIFNLGCQSAYAVKGLQLRPLRHIHQDIKLPVSAPCGFLLNSYHKGHPNIKLVQKNLEMLSKKE
jgi:hypothetical protein